MPDETEPILAREVLRYCMKHPKAADTAEGFARWRLGGDPAPRSRVQVEEALAWLATAGLMREVGVPGGASVYALDPAEAEAARRFLATPEAGGPHGDR